MQTPPSPSEYTIIHWSVAIFNSAYFEYSIHIGGHFERKFHKVEAKVEKMLYAKILIEIRENNILVSGHLECTSRLCWQLFWGKGL